MSLTKPVLGLAVGGVLGLLDGLSGFLEPSLAPVMGSVITFSLLKGLLAGIATGYVSYRVHSMLGILAGIGIAAVKWHTSNSCRDDLREHERCDGICGVCRAQISQPGNIQERWHRRENAGMV